MAVALVFRENIRRHKGYDKGNNVGCSNVYWKDSE